ncbi:sugar phosphate isomerase/epimerase family protein [Alkalihalobacillus sp. 1P02AB]|uniref:sugar phosphate isomerase/epimerase family protein n=1 Tax=Alkalihalobacillus sp. 1P02AB TaxID=3132260 RepID=UPI0039A4E425
MDLKLMKSVWGMTGSLESKLQQIAKAGYAGVESPLPSLEDESYFLELLERFNLELIVQIYTGYWDKGDSYINTLDDHKATLEIQLERASLFNPLLVNSLSAKDSMPYVEQLSFFEHAIELEKQIKIKVAHETHRGRATFTPWGTAQLINDMPDLHLTADFSHWCNVCESMLQDQTENLKRIIPHVIHIHGRVGFEQGPQVPDFRAPEYEYTLVQHEKWWDEICTFQREQGSSYLTFTPEFGPPGYMHTRPFTNEPVVDLWDICFEMGRRFNSHFIQNKNSSRPFS